MATDQTTDETTGGASNNSGSGDADGDGPGSGDAETEMQAAIELLRTMLRIRRFEERAQQLFRDNEIPGFIHLCIGQESVPAGVVGALRADDWITATHRGHGHILAKGAAMGPMMAELMGKSTGYCKGKAGSMHIFDAAVGVLGANGILGAGQPIAVGAALSARLRGTDEVAVTFFGEGASAQGAVHEAMNLAACWQLPVVFVAEINGLAELTAYDVHVSVDSLAERGAAYGIPAESVDGEDPLAVRAAAQRAIDAARHGEGPQLLEVIVRRWSGHFEGDQQRYRDAEELAAVTEHDPIRHLTARLLADDALDDDALAAIEAEIRGEIDEAVEFARDSPLPLPEDALVDVYVDATGIVGAAR